MRIALFHNAPSGGAKRAIYEWTRRLGETHELDVFTLTTANHQFCDIRAIAHRHWMVEFSPRKLLGRPFGRLNQLQRWRDLGDLARIGQRIAKTIDGGNYDVVFAHTCMFTVIPTVLQYLETPSVYYLHEPFGPDFQRAFNRPYLRAHRVRNALNNVDPFFDLYYRRLYAIQRDSVHRSTLLLANSDFTRSQMRLGYGADLPVCHYGVNYEDFRPIANGSKDNFVISVGELSPRKGFDFLVESLGRIPAKERPPLKLICNSVDHAEKDYVEGLAARLGVELMIMTNLNARQLAVEYNRARFCVYAPAMEPFGLVPLEAMACGVPVIGVREGGVSESVVHEATGLLVERDQEQFAQAIRQLLSHPAQVAGYARNCRDYVLNSWSWEHSTDCLDKHLRSCARSSRD